MGQQRPAPGGFSRRRRRVGGAPAEPLESRRLFCQAGPAGDAGITFAAFADSPMPLAAAPSPPTTGAASAAGVPLLHSLPGAPAAAYLDFDGYGSYAPYDTDGDPSTFGPTEQAEITEAWRQVASYFSMLGLDVTTEPPAVPFSYSLISNSVTSGTNLGNFPAVSPTNFNSPSEARDRASALAHEIGHSLGLGHQGVFDLQGVKTDEYSPGYDRLHGAIMGLDAAQDVHKWFIGHPSTSPLLLQDDLAVMAATLAPYTGGDGFRPDDVPGTLDAAVALAVDASGAQDASGIVERLTDSDAYSFTSLGKGVRVDVVPPRPSMLDAKLEVHSADGKLIAAADGPENDQHLHFERLPAGTYYAVVSSHGDYADVGPYELSVREDDAPVDPGPEYNNLPAPTGLILTNGPGTRVDLRWDAVGGADGYAVDRSDDGLVWQPVGTTTGGAATSYADADPPGGHRYFYRTSATDAAGGRSAPSPVQSVVNAPGPVGELTLLNWKSTALVLNWRDTSGETGYRVERRTDDPGSAFAVVGELGPNVISFTDHSFALQTTYRYRVMATSPSGDSRASEEVSGGTPLTTVYGLAVATRQPTQVSLHWKPVWGAVGYSVERSDDGINFAPVGTTTSLSYTDDTVAPVQIYYFRVKGTNVVGETGTSAVVAVATPSAAPPPAPWQVADVGSAASGAGRTFASGSVSYADATGTMQVIGAGYGTFSADYRHDSFRFVYRPLPPGGSITARVAVPNPSLVNAMAGVMIRESVRDDAPFVFTAVSARPGKMVAARQPTGTVFPSSSLGVAPTDPRLWLRISRSGDTFTVSTARGGLWSVLRTYTVPMAESAVAGLVVSSGSDGTLVAASFDDISVSVGGLSIAKPAAASPAQVTTTSTTLSVLGSDDGGETNLTYTWSVLAAPPGAAPPTFNRNRTNLAKNVTATFSATGRYVLGVTISDAQAHSVLSQVTVYVEPQPKLALTPPGVPVPAGGTLQFSAAWVDQFKSPVQDAAAPQVVWQADYGTIDTGGLYTAPAGWSGTAHVTGIASASSATLSVYVYDNATGPTLLSAASRKVHRRRGAFDIPLALDSSGVLSAVEPRVGPTTLVFNLSKPVSAADGTLDATEFVLTNAVFSSAALDGSVLVLDLTGVRNGTLVSVQLRGLKDGDGNPLRGPASVGMRVREGDVTGNGRVTTADVLAMRRQLLRPVRSANFFYDVDLDGMVTAADFTIVKRRWVAALVP
jgi:hypothetical protein